jgi:hypothetical protein
MSRMETQTADRWTASLVISFCQLRRQSLPSLGAANEPSSWPLALALCLWQDREDEAREGHDVQSPRKPCLTDFQGCFHNAPNAWGQDHLESGLEIYQETIGIARLAPDPSHQHVLVQISRLAGWEWGWRRAQEEHLGRYSGHLGSLQTAGQVDRG